MTEVESWDSEPALPVPQPAQTTPVVRQPAGGAIDRHRERGLDFTPEERRARRTNRQVIVALAVSSIVILLLALIATGVANRNEPSGPHIAPPPGYQAINDGYFTYAVPKEWTNNALFTDSVGDVENSAPTGFAAQHIGFRASLPVLGETAPAAFYALGTAHPQPFSLTDGHPISVKGAAAAFAYTATRADGFRASVVDAYDARYAVEMWLIVEGPSDVTDQVLASLQA